MLEYNLGEIVKEIAESWGWNFIPEYEGWDAVVSDGKIIGGIQFKLKLNIHGIVQSLLGDSVNFRVIIFESVSEKHFQDYLLIMNGLKIIPIHYKNGEFIFLFRDKPSWLLKYLHKPKKKLKLPDGKFNIKAGAKAPLQLSERNIFLVELELKTFQKEDRGIGYQDISKLIQYFGKVPNKYFRWDWESKKWYFRDNRLPSKEFPHIVEGIVKRKTS